MEWNEFDSKSAEEILTWAVSEYGSRLGLACSFGMEDMVLIDMISKMKAPVTVFTLDTGRLHEETYATMEKARSRYGIEIKSYFPKSADVETLERNKGFYSFRESIENRKECCAIRKVEPLNRALSELEAWITGLRREQSVTRTDIHKAGPDSNHPKLVKLNPLADWTENQVKAYIEEHKVPVNPLHQRNYPSIGCAPCTRAIEPGEDIRSGRWWWENPEHKECGLHPPK